MVDRAFRLQGLLNLRHLQEEQAAGRLAAAHADLHRVESNLEASKRRLEGCDLSNVTNGQTLAVSAAIRAGARLQIAEHQAKREYAQAMVDARQSEYAGARRQSATLEKLEDRHKSELFADDLHKEQVVLDEIASQRGNNAGGGH